MGLCVTSTNKSDIIRSTINWS